VSIRFTPSSTAGPNVSEELIAEALYPYPPGLVIATKGGWERVGPGQWTHNASPKQEVQLSGDPRHY
jgi:aryl-alcohol dehydrogenase-like predicted oxidoreductase